MSPAKNGRTDRHAVIGELEEICVGPWNENWMEVHLGAGHLNISVIFKNKSTSLCNLVTKLSRFFRYRTWIVASFGNLARPLH